MQEATEGREGIPCKRDSADGTGGKVRVSGRQMWQPGDGFGGSKMGEEAESCEMW